MKESIRNYNNDYSFKSPCSEQTPTDLNQEVVTKPEKVDDLNNLNTQPEGDYFRLINSFNSPCSPTEEKTK